jgi:hypothetical protein
MTMITRRLDVAEEIEAAHALCRDAEAAYIAALSELVDIRTLAGGRDGYDFYVRVPATRMHETTQRIVELEYAIREKYAVHFRTYAIATAD